MTFINVQDYQDFHVAKNVKDRWFKTCYFNESALLCKEFMRRPILAVMAWSGVRT